MKHRFTRSSVLLISFASCVMAESLDVSEQLALVGGLLGCMTVILSSAVVYLFLTILKVRGQVLEFSEVQQQRLDRLENGYAHRSEISVLSTEANFAHQEASGTQYTNEHVKKSNTSVKFASQPEKASENLYANDVPPVIQNVQSPSTVSSDRVRNSTFGAFEHQNSADHINDVNPRDIRQAVTQSSATFATLSSSTCSESSTIEYRYSKPRKRPVSRSPKLHQSQRYNTSYPDSTSDLGSPDDPRFSRQPARRPRYAKHIPFDRNSSSRSDSRYLYRSPTREASKRSERPNYLHSSKRSVTRGEHQLHQPKRRSPSDNEQNWTSRDIDSGSGQPPSSLRTEGSLPEKRKWVQSSFFINDETASVMRTPHEERNRPPDGSQVSSWKPYNNISYSSSGQSTRQ